MDEISGRNNSILLICTRHTIGWISSEMTIISERKPSSKYPFVVFDTSLKFTQPIESELENNLAVEDVLASDQN